MNYQFYCEKGLQNATLIEILFQEIDGIDVKI